jgi:hypothetical protein
VTPLARFVNLDEHLDLLSGRITFNRERAKELITQYIARQACGGSDCGCGTAPASIGQATGAAIEQRRFAQLEIPLTANTANSVFATSTPALPSGLTADQLSDASQFFLKTMTQTINPRDMFRITTTSFMDAWNFDIRQLMKECVHFVLPTGHIIPFSAYNVLYRNGKVPLPALQEVRA